MTTDQRPDVIVIMTDEERAQPPYEADDVVEWRRATLAGRAWFDDHAVNFHRHYTGSLACVPSRPTIFTGQYPDLHGVTQTDGLGKTADDSRLRWLREGEVPTLGHWFRAAGYDTHYDGKWHITHADLHDADGNRLDTNDDDGNVDADAVAAYLEANPLDAFGFDGWVGPEPHGGALGDSGVRRDPIIAARVVAWLEDRYARRAAGDADAQRPFLLVAVSSTRTTSCCSRRGRDAATRSNQGRATRRTCPRHRPRTKIWRANRPPRSPFARPTQPATARQRRSTVRTRRTRSSIATSTTDCTPRSMGRPIRFVLR